MLERTKNDTTGNIGEGTNGKITLADVKKYFKTYNFIINTKYMTIDTSRFYGCAYSTNFLGNNFSPDLNSTLSNVKGLILYTMKPGKKEGNFDDYEEMICIPELSKSQVITNYDIQVKSVRNFLENQKTTEQKWIQAP